MLGPFSTDAFFPSLHAIAAKFSLTPWEMQQTLTVYMLPLSAMSLVQGPLSDSIGRRPVIVGGLLVYTAASVGCAFAPDFAMLLAFRALQGASAGVGTIVGRAVIRDLYDGPQAQRLLSLVAMLFGFAPALAPVIGGWLEVIAGWRSIFGFMAFSGVTLAMSTLAVLPETHPQQLRATLEPGRLARSAVRVLAHREFLLLAIAGGVSNAAVMTYIGAAPSVVEDHWHLEETQFAWLFGPVIGGYVLGAWISGRLAGWVSMSLQARLGFLLGIVACATMVVLQAITAHPPIVAQQALLAAMTLGSQLVVPVLMLRALDIFPHSRGSAAAVQSCISIVIATGVFGALVPLVEFSLLALAEASFVATLLAVGLWLFSEVGRQEST